MNNIKTKRTAHGSPCDGNPVSSLAQSNNQRTVLFQLIILSCILMNMMVSCSNSAKINKINQKQIIGVQLADGDVVTAKTAQINERSDEVLRTFIQKWLYLSFNWTTADVTVEVEDLKVKVPGNVYAATFPITTKDNYRAEYTKELAALITKATGGRKVQSAISIEYISEKPTKIREGLWEVTMVSTWTGMDIENGQEVFRIPFNKKVQLKTIPIASKPTFQNAKELTGMQQIINEINQYGLMLVSIDNYDLQ